MLLGKKIIIYDSQNFTDNVTLQNNYANSTYLNGVDQFNFYDSFHGAIKRI